MASAVDFEAYFAKPENPQMIQNIDQSQKPFINTTKRKTPVIRHLPIEQCGYTSPLAPMVLGIAMK